MFRLLIVPSILCLAIVPLAEAQTPDPATCSVTPCDGYQGMVVSPAAGLEPDPIADQVIEIVVRDSDSQPISNADVSVSFSESIMLCPMAEHDGRTDANGVLTLVLRAGGCAQEPDAGVITANGVVIRTYENVKSPDYDGLGADLVVNEADEVWFYLEYNGTVSSDCHDYDNDGDVDLMNLISFAEAFGREHRCVGVSVEELSMRVTTRISRVAPTPIRDTATIVLSSDDRRTVASLNLYDASGRLLRLLYHGVVGEQRTLTWDGRDSSGESVPAGLYFLALQTGVHRLDSRKIVRVR